MDIFPSIVFRMHDIPLFFQALTEDGTGDTYYFNKATEETTWDHPGAGMFETA